MVTVALVVINIVLGFIPFIGWLLGLYCSPLTFVLWIALMLLALQGKWFKLPFIGDYAEQQATILILMTQKQRQHRDMRGSFLFKVGCLLVHPIPLCKATTLLTGTLDSDRQHVGTSR